MSRAPRREPCTIFTAVATDAVFTVRTYATRRRPRALLNAQIQPSAGRNPTGLIKIY